MKQIRVLSLVCLCAFNWLLTQAQAPCIPNPEIGGAYLHPAILPFAMEGYQYEQVLTFRVPRDTFVVYQTVQVPATIDSARVLHIGGIPAGFSYTCNNATCTWPGGTLGCALLEGFADTSANLTGEYRIRVYIGSWVRAAATDFYRIDSSSSYIFRILAFNGGAEIVPYQKLTLYPNPVKQTLHIELRDIITEQNKIEVRDMQGRIVYSTIFNQPESFLHTYQLDMSQFSKGVYHVFLQTGEEISQARVVVQ